MTNKLVMSTVLPVNALTVPRVQGSGEALNTPSAGFQETLRRTQTDTGNVVRTERTQIGGKAAADALQKAWQSVTGEEASDDTLAVLTAHWAHETGNGKSMMNFNFAGLKGKGPSGLSVACRTREGYGADAVRITDNFRAYRSPEEGATDYLSLLDRRYPKAVEAAKNGDAGGFVSALKERGYFTDNEDTYKARVTQLSRQAMAFGFDAMGSAEASSAIPYEALPRNFPETGGFREAAFVPFDGGRMDFQPSPLASVDSYAFYDEITRASLRIAGDAGSAGTAEEAESRESSRKRTI
jgi:hypothetical protein